MEAVVFGGKVSQHGSKNNKLFRFCWCSDYIIVPLLLVSKIVCSSPHLTDLQHYIVLCYLLKKKQTRMRGGCQALIALHLWLFRLSAPLSLFAVLFFT